MIIDSTAFILRNSTALILCSKESISQLQGWNKGKGEGVFTSHVNTIINFLYKVKLVPLPRGIQTWSKSTIIHTDSDPHYENALYYFTFIDTLQDILFADVSEYCSKIFKHEDWQSLKLVSSIKPESGKAILM